MASAAQRASGTPARLNVRWWWIATVCVGVCVRACVRAGVCLRLLLAISQSVKADQPALSEKQQRGNRVRWSDIQERSKRALDKRHDHEKIKHEDLVQGNVIKHELSNHFGLHPKMSPQICVREKCSNQLPRENSHMPYEERPRGWSWKQARLPDCHHQAF